MKLGEIIGEIEEIREQGYGEYITVEGVKIRYLVGGSGAPVLLLHGFGGFLETWAFNIPALSKRYRVYAIDLPGHGLSDEAEGCYTLAAANECVAGIMEALGIKHASLIGHSLGGAVSLRIALDVPECVEKLVLVDSAGLSSSLPWLYRLSTLPVLGRILMTLMVSPALELSLKRLFYEPGLLSGEMLDVVLTHSRRPGAKENLLEIIRQNASFRGPRPEAVMMERLPELKVPTLFIHGAQDRLFPLKHAQDAFGLVPNARVKIFDQCGHCPHIEKAIEFNAAVMDFLGVS